MSTELFVIPLKIGKTEEYKSFIHECLGPRKDEYADLLLRYGLNTLTMWIHVIDGKDYAIFTHEVSDNAADLLTGWATSSNEFDQWFNSKLCECYGVSSLDELPTPPVFSGAIDARAEISYKDKN